MKFKLLCSDLDGTLLSTKSDVSNFTISQIARIKNDLRIILVSARMPSAMHYLQKRLGIENEPIICYNGALIIDKNTEILSVTIPVETVHKIQILCKNHKTDVGVYSKDSWYTPKMSNRVEKEIKHTKTKPILVPPQKITAQLEKDNVGAHKLMLMGTKESSDILFPILQDTFNEYVQPYRSNDTLIEVAPTGVSKLTAIRVLLDKNETLKDVIAFGDNYNDIDMLKNVGLGVAVANARPEVKSISATTTLSNIEDGVAHFIKTHLID